MNEYLAASMNTGTPIIAPIGCPLPSAFAKTAISGCNPFSDVIRHNSVETMSGNQLLVLVNVALKNYFNVALCDDNARSDSSMAMMLFTIERERLVHHRHLC